MTESLRWSTLSAALDSALHLHHRMLTPRDDTPAMAMGRAIHAAVLTPAEFERLVVEVPDQFVTASGALSTSKDAKAWRAEQPADGLYMTRQQRDTCHRIALAIHGHRDACDWLDASTVTEQRIQWSEQAHGLDLAMVGTPDAVAPHLGLVWDLKTTAAMGGALSVDACARMIIARHYAGQLANYAVGLAKQPEPVSISRIGWIFVEQVAPFDVCVLEADDDLIAWGQAERDRAIEVYCKAVQSGEWPGCAPKKVTVSVPAWMRAKQAAADSTAIAAETRAAIDEVFQ